MVSARICGWGSWHGPQCPEAHVAAETKKKFSCWRSSACLVKCSGRRWLAWSQWIFLSFCAHSLAGEISFLILLSGVAKSLICLAFNWIRTRKRLSPRGLHMHGSTCFGWFSRNISYPFFSPWLSNHSIVSWPATFYGRRWQRCGAWFSKLPLFGLADWHFDGGSVSSLWMRFSTASCPEQFSSSTSVRCSIQGPFKPSVQLSMSYNLTEQERLAARLVGKGPRRSIECGRATVRECTGRKQRPRLPQLRSGESKRWRKTGPWNVRRSHSFCFQKATCWSTHVLQKALSTAARRLAELPNLKQRWHGPQDKREQAARACDMPQLRLPCCQTPVFLLLGRSREASH